MEQIQEYTNAINEPLSSGSTSPMTVITPKMAHKAVDKIKQGIQAINQMQEIHRANMKQQDQIKQQQDYMIQQDQNERQQKMQVEQKANQKTDDLIEKINAILE